MKVGDYVRIKWGNGLQTISKYKNIVDELEKEVKNKLDNYKYTRSAEKLVIVGTLKYVLDIIKELKGE